MDHQWATDAHENAHDWFPEMSKTDLDGSISQALDLAGNVGRSEREFHELFEWELRRVVEEREVVGADGSVLPPESADPVQPFPVEPEPIPVDEQPGPLDELAEADDPDRLFVLEVGALRFQDDLSPTDVQAELGVDAAYYEASMSWLLEQVDATLEGDYPAHVDRVQMADFAAGLSGAEARFAVERHVRDCSGCAAYLADLLEATLRTVAPHQSDPRSYLPTRKPPPVTYTRDNAWTRELRSRRRPRDQAPALSVKAAELRTYSRPSKSISFDAPTEPLPRTQGSDARSLGEAFVTAQGHARSEATGPTAATRRPRRLMPIALVAVAVAIVAVAMAALSGGDENAAREQTAAARSKPAAGVKEQRSADRRRAVALARERRQRAAQPKRVAHRKRVARRKAQARLVAKRRMQQQQTANAAPPPTAEPAPAPTPAPQPTPTPPVSTPPPPAPSTPPPSGGSGEFGLEP